MAPEHDIIRAVFPNETKKTLVHLTGTNSGLPIIA